MGSGVQCVESKCILNKNIQNTLYRVKLGYYHVFTFELTNLTLLFQIFISLDP